MKSNIMTAEDFKEITNVDIINLKPGDFIIFSMSKEALKWGVENVIECFMKFYEIVPIEVSLAILPDLSLYDEFGEDATKAYIQKAIANYEEHFGKSFNQKELSEYIDHLLNCGLGKKKSLEFIKKRFS